jgi:hypothetical protein
LFFAFDQFFVTWMSFFSSFFLFYSFSSNIWGVCWSMHSSRGRLSNQGRFTPFVMSDWQHRTVACDVSWLVMCRWWMRHGGRQRAMKGKLQLGCDGPCGGDEQARLGARHHAVVQDKWRLGVDGPREARQSHTRSTWCSIKARWHGDRATMVSVESRGARRRPDTRLRRFGWFGPQNHQVGPIS